MKPVTTLYLILSLFIAAACSETENSINPNTNIVFCAGHYPEFPGGFDSLRIFIKQNLMYPRAIDEYEGSVYVEFIVNEDGSLADFKVVKGLCTICDSNAIEMLKKMPKWIPVYVDHKAVKSKMIIPICYRLY